jgi:hypothetical protein
MTFFDALKARNPASLTVSPGKRFSDIVYHDEPPEYPRCSAEGVLHVIRKTGESHVLSGLQYSFLHSNQSKSSCPELLRDCTRVVSTCRGVFICQYASSSFAAQTHSSVDLYNPIFVHNEIHQRRRALLRFLLAVEETKCRDTCVLQRSIVQLTDTPNGRAVACQGYGGPRTSTTVNSGRHLFLVVPGTCTSDDVYAGFARWAEDRTSTQQALLDLVEEGEFCDTIYAFNRRPKDDICQRHTVSHEREQSATLKPLTCKVRAIELRFEPPIGLEFLIMEGEHAHPPPPRAKIPSSLTAAITRHVHQRPTETAMRVMMSSDLWGDGKSAVNAHPGLGNVDSIQRVITSARGSKHGEGFEGICHEMIRPRDSSAPSPFENHFRDYVQFQTCYGDGHVYTLCMFLNDYEKKLLNRARYLEGDVYFKTLRAPNTILSFSTWDFEADMQVVVARFETNRSSSEEQFYRMIIALFNILADNGVRVTFASAPGGWRFVLDFCMPQAKALARAACRLGGDVCTVEEMFKLIIDGCKTHRDKMIRKVALSCVVLLEKKDRPAEKKRIEEQLMNAAAESLEGSWQRAWADIATQYPHVAKKAEWWCDPLVMSMCVFAERSTAPSADVPDSTNQEEGFFFGLRPSLHMRE